MRRGDEQEGAKYSLSLYRSGETLRIVLDPTGAQLSNKGGQISLLDNENRSIHPSPIQKARHDRIMKRCCSEILNSIDADPI
ncbi:MAG TPA: hypothetical protein PKM20_11640, partial [Nitrosomonas sp.]|nr:hypothetical protein [Nitrosomonas sp.]